VAVDHSYRYEITVNGTDTKTADAIKQTVRQGHAEFLKKFQDASDEHQMTALG
jgi:hypothetical protein